MLLHNPAQKVSILTLTGIKSNTNKLIATKL